MDLNRKHFKTPFGEVITTLDLFPLIYLIFIFGFLYWIPFEIFGTTLYEVWAGHESLSEKITFLEYIAIAICSLILIKISEKKRKDLSYLFLFFTAIFLAYEEISFLGIFQNESIQNANLQNEVNLHNLFFLQKYLNYCYVVFCLILGWLGWKYISFIDFLPKKEFCLYFLFPSLYFTYNSFGFLNNTPFPYQQEVFEFLIPTGLLLSCFEKIKIKKGVISRIKKN